MKFYDPLARTTVYQNNLTHWEQDHATYFITFRLADSIPAEAIQKLSIKRETWLLANPRPWTDELEMEFHKRFSHKLDEWMDLGHGECLLRRSELREPLAEIFLSDHGKAYQMMSFVIMPNHVHLLASLIDMTLPEVMRKWKGSSARAINQLADRTGTLWQKDYFDRLIRDPKHLFRVTRYIQNNPTKAKLPEGHFTLWPQGEATSVA
ncbi:transposase [Haloferula chungangensis]|uniref:Transposase n=1 Tax=Haloferula chungangensis TaxID=1048331 RepID=A0ABW2L6K7_9BACT